MSGGGPQQLSGPGMGEAPAGGGNAVNNAAVDIMGAFSKAQQAVGSAQADLAQQQQKLNKGGEAQQDAIKAGGEAAVAIQTETEKAAIKLQTQRSAVAAEWGANPDAPSYVLGRMAMDVLAIDKELDTRYNKLQGQRSSIEEKQNTGIFPNPLDWIYSSLTLPSDIEAFNLSAGSYNLAKERQSEKLELTRQLIARSSEEGTLLATINTGASETRLAAMNAATKAKADADVALSQMNLAKLGIDVLNIRAALDERSFTNTIALNNALGERERLQLSRTAEQRAIESHNLQMEVSKWTLEDKKGNRAAEDELTARLNRATKVYGIAPLTWTQLKLMPDGKMRAELEKLMIDPDVQEERAGHNPVDAVMRLNNLNARSTGADGLTRKAIGDMILAGHQDPTVQMLKGPEQLYAIQKQVETRLNTELRNIQMEGGVYSPLPLKGTVTIPAVQALKISQGLNPLAAANEQYRTKADDVVNIAIDMIQKGDLNEAAAAKEISILYKAMQTEMNTTKQFSKFAVPRLDDKTGYKQTVTGSFTSWKGSQVLDMTNQAAVENFLTRARISRDLATGLNTPAAGSP